MYAVEVTAKLSLCVCRSELKYSDFCFLLSLIACLAIITHSQLLYQEMLVFYSLLISPNSSSHQKSNTLGCFDNTQSLCAISYYRMSNVWLTQRTNCKRYIRSWIERRHKSWAVPLTMSTAVRVICVALAKV